MDSIVLNSLRRDDERVSKLSGNFACPEYHPSTHVLDLTRSPFYAALLTIRHHLRVASDRYFGTQLGMTNVDLFMLTPSVSSPMGPGSDSEAVQVRIGDLDTYLVDSSQFGFEPLLLNQFDAVYCYLPSMRGEDHDERHLNQFFHCEAEIVGTIDDLLPIVDGYVREMASTILGLTGILQRMSLAPEASQLHLKRLVELERLPSMTFDQAIDLLRSHGRHDGFRQSEFGRDLTTEGEVALFELTGIETPLWVRGYDRDRVAFYQKPAPGADDKVINADLLFPPIAPGGLAGEIAGAGQRQDSSQEMLESLQRQGISTEPYLWYIGLRDLPGYSPTSGFGLGIERFIAWALGHADIRLMIPYPRLKNVHTLP